MSHFNRVHGAGANELWVSKHKAMSFADMRGKTPASPQEKNGEKGF
jgi:hypothetical protein